jgi:transcriptional regulator with XRE-family HTH domain
MMNIWHRRKVHKMVKKGTSTFEDLIIELEKDPEFRREDRRQKPYYDLILEIIKRRRELNLTQKELATRVGTRQSSISRIESGEHNIRLSTLIEIAEALQARVRIRLIPLFYVDDEEYRNLVNASASNKPEESTASLTTSSEKVKV